MQFLAVLVHYFEKVAHLLEPQAALDLEAAHGTEFTQGGCVNVPLMYCIVSG
jgi:hypothetical protein